VVSLPLKARLESYLEARLDSIYVDIARDCVEKIGLQSGVLEANPRSILLLLVLKIGS
jgi:hypothetical protein